MNKKLKQNFLIMAAGLCVLPASAQLSSNPNKFLGNITTSYSVDAGGGVPAYYTLWNQITCENESKWSLVEGNRGVFNWGGSDNAFNYAKQHNFPHKFHALVWGAQYPSWLENLSPKERYAAYVNWFNHVKAKYNTLPMIDVVNEAVGTHQPGNPLIKASLGGGGKTGYDWLIKAFEMAYERWPDAILIYNDYNSIRGDIDNYITLVQTLRDAGAPIDAYGNQAHELAGCSANELSNALKKQQDALKMPMYITEYDIGDYDPQTHGNTQKTNFQTQIPLMWEAPYCAGVTLWGYVYGKTWIHLKDSNNQDLRDENGNLVGPGISGLYINGEERPAMTWLKEYMATDAAKNATGPFPGAKKEASIYIRPAALKVAKGDVLPIKVHASMATKTIEKVDFYVGTKLVKTMTEAPYIVEYTVPASSSEGWKDTKAVVTATDGTTYERYGRFRVLSSTIKREPYNETVPMLPATIKAEEYDKGASGVSYNNIYVSRDKFNTTATITGAWMEYTVDVQEEGLYTMDIEVASESADGMFHIAEYSLDSLTYLTDFTEVPNTGNKTEFWTLRCPMKVPLKAGRHVLTFLVEKGGFCVKSLTVKPVQPIPVVSLPGTVEIEDYVSCSNGIDIINGNGGYVLSNTAKDEWLEYTVDFSQEGKYSYEATVSSDVDNSKFSMVLIDSKNNETFLSNVSVPKTGSLGTYQVKKATIRNVIKAGQQKLRITITSGGCNIDKVKFISANPSGIDEVENDDAVSAPAYNLYGMPVGDGYRGIVIKNGKKILRNK